MPSEHPPDLRAWIGRRETAHDVARVAPALGLAATLDRPDLIARLPTPGAVLPPAWHWLYFLPTALQSTLGPDGHPIRGGFLPPVTLPRRMWAGSRLTFPAAIAFDAPLERSSTIAAVEHKSGRSGALVLVTVRHEIRAHGALAVTDEHDIVYRQAPQPGAPAAPPAEPEPARAADFRRTVTPDPVLLFRYSALTFNGHRIHYDRRYAIEVGKYPGLVVHGPLIATLLVDLVRDRVPGAELVEYQFKAIRPAFALAPMTANGRPAQEGKTVELWASDGDGYLTMKATAKLR